ncbi:hypothetical protein N7519_000995 [Penicillium mononematosum]|uniref:uncharacterized protein n=1 Tax=Penicillium mononematosum TaxID=268346 RepID=UPI0025499372|nr:uncharacterized protein N7519_000995 [Penicillium mononematosum]KAJ6190974.1 hypothetical protein N7519_000995 [Penicillium mononematosum]
MYMCSNTGLSGWAELRNRTQYLYCPNVAGQMLHVTLGPGCRLPDSLFPPLTSPPPPRFVRFLKNTSDSTTLV